jgi:hypothetical protein
MFGEDDCKVITIPRRETGSILVNDLNSEVSDDDIELLKNGIN